MDATARPRSTKPISTQLAKGLRIGEVKVIGLLLNILALILLAMIIRKGWNDLDTYYDSLDYHLPLAALRAGIVSAKDYRPRDLIIAVYNGFPVIPDFLQGWAWRITSRLQAVNLVGLAGLLAFAAAAARWFRIPFAEIVLCLLAVPSILIACSSAYVDLWVNSVTAILILLLFRAFVKPEVVTLRDIFVGLASFTVALNSKLQFLPVASLALVILAIILWVNRSRLHELRLECRKLSTAGRLILALVAIALIGSGYINTLKNWLLFGNPVYPVIVSVGPLHWPGMPQMNDGHEPVYLAHSLQPVKWLLSIFEYDAFDGRRPTWVIDAGSLPSASSNALRMGGYFGAYVALNLLWFAFLNRSEFRRYGRRPIFFFLGLSVITACLPISHELRYYSFWMMSLVVINLFLVHETRDSRSSSSHFPFLGGALACLMFVILSNGALYVTSNAFTPEALVSNLGVSRSLLSMQLRRDERVCLLGKGIVSFMYAPLFNPEIANLTHYHTVVAENDAQCQGARKVP